MSATGTQVSAAPEAPKITCLKTHIPEIPCDCGANAESQRGEPWHATVTFTLDHEALTAGRWHIDAATGRTSDDHDRYTREITEEEVIEHLEAVVLDACETRYVIGAVQKVPGAVFRNLIRDATDHADFVNELLDDAPDCYDGDESAEDIALRYVRDLERIRDYLRYGRTADMDGLYNAMLANGIADGIGEAEDGTDA
jgi:hypothetical protein